MTHTLWLMLLVIFGLIFIHHLGHRCVRFLFILYIIVILGFTLVRPSGTREIRFIPDYHTILAVPWKNHGQYMAAEWIDNILLFIPFGFLMKKTLLKMKKRRAVLLIVAFPVLIEVMQYIFAVGICEINDVIHNTIGALIGYIIGKN